MGRRDYAILMLLSRLGMRAGEVADLKLEDIDWQGSDLIIRGKGARIDQMPLPEDVGAAIADYLQYGRPVRSPSRNVFLTLRCRGARWPRPGCPRSLPTPGAVPGSPGSVLTGFVIPSPAICCVKAPR